MFARSAVFVAESLGGSTIIYHNNGENNMKNILIVGILLLLGPFGWGVLAGWILFIIYGVFKLATEEEDQTCLKD